MRIYIAPNWRSPPVVIADGPVCSRNMFPVRTFDDECNGSGGNIEAFCNLVQVHPLCAKPPYLRYIGIGQLCARLLCAKRRSTFRAPLRGLVRHVLSMGSKEQMAGIAAWRGIAMMADAQAGRNWAEIDYPGDPMRQHCLIHPPCVAIARLIFAALPFPAGIVTTRTIYFRPEQERIARCRASLLRRIRTFALVRAEHSSRYTIRLDSELGSTMDTTSVGGTIEGHRTGPFSEVSRPGLFAQRQVTLCCSILPDFMRHWRFLCPCLGL